MGGKDPLTAPAPENMPLWMGDVLSRLDAVLERQSGLADEVKSLRETIEGKIDSFDERLSRLESAHEQGPASPA